MRFQNRRQDCCPFAWRQRSKPSYRWCLRSTRPGKGTREIRVILYVKADSFYATALADELSVEDILAIEHDIIPLDGADVF
jgi:hypothetical protein